MSARKPERPEKLPAEQQEQSNCMKNIVAHARKRRKLRIRAKVIGTSDRPRLSVFRSGRFISAQIIDDAKGSTIVAASEKELKEKKSADNTKSVRAKNVGMLIAKKALEKKITGIRFDRNGYAYHGRVKALSEGAREGGLEF